MKRLVATLFPLFFILALLIPKAAFAGDVNEEDVKKNLPKMLGANNVGKEFWFTIPPCFEDESGGHDNFVKIFVTSPVRTLVTVEVPGKGYIKLQNTIPNDVIEFNITPTDGQPYVKGGRDPEVAEQRWPGAGIHVYADYPLVVYCVVRYWYTSDGFLALPVSSLGKEYIVAGYPSDPMFRAVWNYKLPNTSGIVAAYNDTKVRFTMGGTPASKTAGGLTPGKTDQIVLQKGDVWMFSGMGDGSDLSGSKIVASKPVAVVTGNQCNNIPNGNQWCDYTVEMDLPTFTWGKFYHVPKVPNRKYPSIVRIFAKEKNTKLFKDGKAFGAIPEAGGILGKGYQDMRMSGMDVPPASAVFSADKPIGITLYNTGVQEDGYPAPNSDPFVMAITPIEQYQKEITFCTPGFQGTGFAENYVNLVYEVDEFGMMPNDVEFAQVVGGQFAWTKVNSRFPAVDELFKIDVDGKKYAVKCITLPGDGTFKIRAKKPFAAYSFGYDSYDSYGFPTSAALADLERPDTIAPDPKWITDCTGMIEGATVTDLPNDAEVRSNLSMIVFHADTSFNYEFEYEDFTPGEDAKTTWKLKIVDPTKDALAVISFTDRRGNDTTIYINYTATKLTIRPNNVDFGNLKVGNKVTKDFWAINYSTQSQAMIDKHEFKLKDQNFVIDNIIPFGSIIPPNDSVKFTVTFTAVTSGEFIDSLGIGDTCVFAYKARVRATVGMPIIWVEDYDFGKVAVSQKASKALLIKNEGTTDLRITGYSGPSLPVYKVLNLPTMDANNPLIIKPNGSYVFNVEFRPTAEQVYPDQIVFFNDATSVDSIAIINGEGIKPQLIANPKNWDRVRINRPNFTNDGPYPWVDGVHDALYLYNDGSQDLNITSVRIIEDVNGNAFKFDRGFLFSPFVVRSKDSVKLPVEFDPTQVGPHKLVLEYVNNQGVDGVQTVMEGIGILPKISTSDVDFGRTLVGDFANPQRRTVTIKNENYDWEDSVLISDLLVQPNGNEIAENLTNWGSEGFRYDKTALPLNSYLQPGGSLVFDAEFVATRVANNMIGKLTTVSDAEQDVTSTWTGAGYSQNLTAVGGSARICVGDTREINVVINGDVGTGTSDVITIESIKLSSPVPSLAFKNPADEGPFTLTAADLPKTVTFVYTPTTVGKESVRVIIETDIKENPVNDEAVIDIEAVHYTIDTKVELTNTFPTIFDKPEAIVTVDTRGQNISMAQLSEIDVVVSYNYDFVKAKEVVLGSGINGKFEFKNPPEITDKGKVYFTLVAKDNNIIQNDGELVRIKFDLFLPKTQVDTSDIIVNVTERNNACIHIENEHSKLKLQPTCAFDIRKIISYGSAYGLGEIAPNPVGSNGTDIQFSVGLETNTEISIFNSLGELVAMPVNGVMKPGSYNIHLTVDNLTSGAYVIKMVSGPYRGSRELIINK